MQRESCIALQENPREWLHRSVAGVWPMDETFHRKFLQQEESAVNVTEL